MTCHGLRCWRDPTHVVHDIAHAVPAPAWCSPAGTVDDGAAPPLARGRAPSASSRGDWMQRGPR
eukprot:2465643-Alexandrium_andersonii.AAC.1